MKRVALAGVCVTALAAGWSVLGQPQSSPAKDTLAVERAWCSLLDQGRRAITRPDLEGCASPWFDTTSCAYLTEIQFELVRAKRSDLSERIAVMNEERTGSDCAKSLSFALRHGLPAFRDHWKEVQEAVAGAVGMPR